MIYCLPWQVWKYEIKVLPISAQTLFANRGIEIEKVEEELKQEGYLHQSEILLEVLKEDGRLLMSPQEFNTEENIGDFPEEWDEEDFLYYQENKTSY